MGTGKINITIIGLGLIGGSLGLLLKERTKSHVVGFSLHPSTHEKALKIGAVDETAKSLREAVKEADLIFIATPISKIPDILMQIKNFLKAKAIVMDIASVKKSVMDKAEKILSPDITFIGTHPMAGKEKSGIDNADIDLLKGCLWVLTPTKNTKKQKLNKVIGLINQIGCKPLILNPKFHDEAVACVSHLPAVLSSILCTTVAGEKDWLIKQQLAAEGFRDTSRLVANPPSLHTEFCLENQRNIEILINKTIENLKTFKNILKHKDKDKILALFTRAQKIRNDWWQQSRFNES